MARLSDLVSVLAKTLNVDEATVALIARYLREAGLISQKGRGRGAAHMTPRDAANLLIGVMASSATKGGPESVRLVREAAYDGAEKNFTGDVIDEPPPFPFLVGESGPRTLGDALEALIEEIVLYGDPQTDQRMPMTNFWLHIVRPGLEGRMELDDGTDVWTARYRRQDPRFDGLKGEAIHKAAREILVPEQGRMKTRTEVAMEAIWRTADAIRGYEPSEGELVRPPYEKRSK